MLEPPAPARVTSAAGTPQTWRPITKKAPFSAVAPVLLTDGRVMVQELDSERWWQLVPDEMGSYENGSWSFLSAMPAGYTPLYTATGVLGDGRVIVEGGEYLAGQTVWTTRGAIYDPVANAWTNVQPPVGWTSIGDASGIVLPNGVFMLSNCCTDELALFDAQNLMWTPVGMGKRDINDEESWVQLWDDTLLTVDTNNLTDLTAAEIFTPSTGMWTSAGDTPVQISDTTADNKGTHEIGPEILMPTGDVLALGGNGHNVVYHTATQTWSTAPDLPTNAIGQLAVADGPGAIMPDGHVIFGASPGFGGQGTTFFEWDGTSFTQAPATPNAANDSSYNNFMLVLPTGEIMLTDFSGDVELYTPTATITQESVPVITAAPTPIGVSAQPLDATPVATLVAGQTYKLEADRINGISQGAYYGDDLQAYTNYPVVRITNGATGHVRYCKTHDHQHRKIGPASHGSTQFDIPLDIDRGPGTIETVANGIASPPVEINVR